MLIANEHWHARAGNSEELRFACAAALKTVDGLEILDGGDGLVDCGYLTTGKLLREGAKSLDSQSDEV